MDFETIVVFVIFFLVYSSTSWGTPVRVATAAFATIRGLPQIFARTLAVLPAVKEAKTIQMLVLLS